METGFVVLIVGVLFIVGIVLGAIISRRLIQSKRAQGILFIDRRDPEYAPSMFLEVTVPIEEILSQKQVNFTVSELKENSQK